MAAPKTFRVTFACGASYDYTTDIDISSGGQLTCRVHGEQTEIVSAVESSESSNEGKLQDSRSTKNKDQAPEISGPGRFAAFSLTTGVFLMLIGVVVGIFMEKYQAGMAAMILALLCIVAGAISQQQSASKDEGG